MHDEVWFVLEIESALKSHWDRCHLLVGRFPVELLLKARRDGFHQIDEREEVLMRSLAFELVSSSAV